MRININEVMFALSAALDCVEKELVGIQSNHSKRVAYLSTLMGLQMGKTQDELFYIGSAAVLHDNALTEFIQEELEKGALPELKNESGSMAPHCVMGERNIEQLPFYKQIRESVLYHHERADGEGPFGKKYYEIPLFARLIHFSDTIDAQFGLDSIDDNKRKSIIEYVKLSEGSLFDGECIDAFVTVFSAGAADALSNERLDSELRRVLPVVFDDYSGDELIAFSTIFAKIVDYKSHFTCSHSLGIAQKLYAMGEYYCWDELTRQKLYFAGALHDIGKLTVTNDILEKPDKLTDDEYGSMKNHAEGTRRILYSIDGLEDIAHWAGAHHEKLDGSGYPLGLTAEELDDKQRLLACVDIYQALREPRPYKDGMTHIDTMEIMYKMARNNKIDIRITHDIDLCFASQD